MSVTVRDADGNLVALESITTLGGEEQIVNVTKSVVTAINEGTIAGTGSIKFGRIPTMNVADAPADVWPLGATVGVIAEKTSGATLSVVSDNANDTSAGTGAQKIVIEGIDENWDYQSDLITLNGITPVVTTTQWIAVNRAYVDDVGNVDDANTGNISMTHSGDIIAYIEATEGQTAQAYMTTPRNTITLCTGPYLGIIKSGTGRIISARMRTKEFGKGWRTRAYGEASSSGTSYVQTPAGDLPAYTVGGKGRIKGTVIELSTNDTGCTAGWGYIQLPTA